MPYPHTPGSKGEADTGKKAAKQMKDKAGTLRRMALDCLSINLFRADLDGRPSGMTADEVAAERLELKNLLLAELQNGDLSQERTQTLLRLERE